MHKFKITVFLGGIILIMILSPAKTFALDTLRVEGTDRYETAVELSQNNWESSEYVVLASGQDFPDALCASPLAKKYNAPILLVSKDSIGDKTLKEINRLKPKSIYIVGGSGVISESIQDKLSGMGIICTRLGGKDRYETSLKVANALQNVNSVFIASGENFPDAISAASIASIKNSPIILTSRLSLPAEIQKYANSSSITKKYVIGGTGAVSDAVLNKLSGAERVYGQNRYETNVAVINKFQNEYDFTDVFAASGKSYPDALTGSAAASKIKAPAFIIDDNSTPFVKDYMITIKDKISTLTAIGGRAVLSPTSIKIFLSEFGVKVVIDPGHGGYDPGAIGYSGSKEKDINLAVALDAGKILQSKGLDVIYTRNSDNVSWSTDILNDLQTRCDIANKNNADYFISIHCDSYISNKDANGTSTYYYSLSNEAAKLAAFMQGQITNYMGTSDRGVKTANYYVIKNTNCSSILIELGFLSNPHEEQQLKSESYQKKWGNAIADAFMNYIEKQ